MTMPRPSNNRTRVGVTIAVVAVVLVGVVVPRWPSASNDGGYRTATVERATVTKTLQGSGTITPVDRVAVAFPGSGTVRVGVGEGRPAVTVGQTLASLDTASLRREPRLGERHPDPGAADLSEAEAGSCPRAPVAGARPTSVAARRPGAARPRQPPPRTPRRPPPRCRRGAEARRRRAGRDGRGAERPSGSGGSTSLAAQIKAAQHDSCSPSRSNSTPPLAEARADLAAAKAACSSPSTPTSTTARPSSPAPARARTHSRPRSMHRPRWRPSRPRSAPRSRSSTRCSRRPPAANTGSGPTPPPPLPAQRVPARAAATRSQRAPAAAPRADRPAARAPAPRAAPRRPRRRPPSWPRDQSEVDAAVWRRMTVAEQSLAAASIVSLIDGTATSATLAKGLDYRVSASSTTAETVAVVREGRRRGTPMLPCSVTIRRKRGDRRGSSRVVPDRNGKALKGTVAGARSRRRTTSGLRPADTAIFGLTRLEGDGVLHDGCRGQQRRSNRRDRGERARRADPGAGAQPPTRPTPSPCSKAEDQGRSP